MAAVGIVLALPLMLLIAVLIKLTSRGPVFFTQMRIGMDRRSLSRVGGNTRRQIFLYSLPMTAAAVAPWPLGLTGAIYGASATALSLAFVILAALVLVSRTTEPAQMRAEKRLFGFSVLYLFALFGALVADRWIAW